MLEKMMPLKKQKTRLIVLSIVLIAVVASHISWIEDDLGYLITIDGKPIDLIGNIKNKVTTTTRNCESVVRVLPEQLKYQIAQTSLASCGPDSKRKLSTLYPWLQPFGAATPTHTSQRLSFVTT